MASAKAKPVARPGPQSRPASQLASIAALALLAFAVYANSLGNGFVGDDKLQLLANPLLTDVGRIPQIFGSGVWAFRGYHTNYYRPAQFLVYMLLYHAAGFQAVAFHLFMVLLHAGNTVLVYVLVSRLLSSERNPAPALAAAALFAVHPIHSEVVDWVAALPDLLLTTVVLAAMLAFVRQGGLPRGRQIAAHCGWYFAALLTKETGVMLVPLYLGLEWFWLGRPLREMRRNAALYGGMAATLGVYLAMRAAALGSLAPAQATFYHLSPPEFLLSAVVTAAAYFEKLVLPIGLNYFHVFQPTRAINGTFLMALAALAALAYAALRLRRRALLSYGIFWIAATIAPALNLTGVGQNVFAERYLYLPSVGLVWIAAAGWQRLARWSPRAGWMAAAATLLACSAVTVLRNQDWKDDYTLLTVTLRQSPTAGHLHNDLAGVYIQRDEFRKALDEERLAVKYDPDAPAFHQNLGNILLGMDARAAAAEFETVLKLQPTSAEAHSSLGLAWQALGDGDRAAAEFQRALALEPGLQEAAEGLAAIRRRSKP